MHALLQLRIIIIYDKIVPNREYTLGPIGRAKFFILRIGLTIDELLPLTYGANTLTVY